MLHNPDWDRNSNSSILNRAANLLEKHGHTKWILKDSDGSMCANGAIFYAVEQDHDRFIAAADALASHLGFHDRCMIPRWNNVPERTAEQVIDALRLAAIKAAEVS